jgi:hypothetical protein
MKTLIRISGDLANIITIHGKDGGSTFVRNVYEASNQQI